MDEISSNWALDAGEAAESVDADVDDEDVDSEALTVAGDGGSDRSL